MEQEYIIITLSVYKFYSPEVRDWLENYQYECFINHNNFGKVMMDFGTEYPEEAVERLRRISSRDDFILRATYV